MSSARPLDNANPTIINPTSSTSAHHAHASKGKVSRRAQLADLWKTSNSGSSDEDDEEEEVFVRGLGAGDEQIRRAILGEEEDEREEIDSREIFDLLRSITDPEHPLTLEQLAVVSEPQIQVSNKAGRERVFVEFTPTIPHCSMATLIGLTLRVRLLRALPPRYKIDIRIKEGMHQSENAVNKQLNDKERVQAALENQHLLGVVEGCLSTAHKRGAPIDQA